MDHISAMQIPVCSVFASNGFQIEYMPDFLKEEAPEGNGQAATHEWVDNFSPHIHSFYEILWFQEGVGKHTVDFMEYEVRPNTIFFMAPGQIHYFDHSDYKGVSIKVCNDFLQQEEWQVPASNKSGHGNASPNLFLKYDVFHNFFSSPCFLIDDNIAGELRELVCRMEKEANLSSSFGNTEMLHSLMRILLILVYRNGVKLGAPAANDKRSEKRLFPFSEIKPSHHLFIRFRSLVEKDYQHNHSISDYARRLNTNVRTLNASVNECSGMSPHAFISARVILEAKRLVRYSDMRIKEIAFALGYDDPSYFVRMFKRHTGYMPTEFREADNIIQ